MAHSTDIWTERDQWGGPLGLSVVLHLCVFGGIVLYAIIVGSFRGSDWGGSGAGDGAISATLVSSIPLPANPNGTNVVATGSKGVSETQPKVEEKLHDAIPI